MPARSSSISASSLLGLLTRAPRTLGRHALSRVDAHAKRRGLGRREFLQTSAGMATVLFATNELLGCNGNGYALPRGAAIDDDAARARLSGKELVFDAHTQHASNSRPWYRHNPSLRFLSSTAQADCGEPHWAACYSRERYLKQVFLESDTDLAVLTALPGELPGMPLFAREMSETRALAERVFGGPRVLIHGLVQPNTASPEVVRERMQEMNALYAVDAFKLCPGFGPRGVGYFVDSDATMAAIQAAVDIGVRRIAVHKGLPLPGTDPAFSSARDIGPVAKAFPEVTFFVSHAAYDLRHREGAYREGAARGIDALIASLQAHGIGAGGNVYAELGGAFRALIVSPDEAAHAIGKLLVHLGEDRVLWGSGAICEGCPQRQIEAFRAFEIGASYQERFGYPALTAARKQKILGWNAVHAYGLSLDDVVSAVEGRELVRAAPSRAAARTRRELLAGFGRAAPR